MTTDELAYAYGMPVAAGRLRGVPEDFGVRELPGFALDGSGEHVYLKVRKRGANTDWVARQLAAFAGVAAGAVSYAGLKDRHAVTEQWFSVHLPGRADPDWSSVNNDEYQVLEHTRHSRKLRRGALTGNAFAIVVRELSGTPAELEARWARIRADGVPNYFGEQRFGHGGGNIAAATAWLAGERQVRDRQQRSLYLSAARSLIFNQVLSARVRAGTWATLLAGDVAMLAGSHSIFPVAELDETLARRAAEGDVQPTGPLWGAGELMTQGAVQALEQTTAAAWPVLSAGLVRADLRQERRALRLRLGEGTLAWLDDSTLRLCFTLPAGAYATTVLRELLTVTDA